MIEGCLREIALPYTLSRIGSWTGAISAHPLQRGRDAVILAMSDTALQLASEGAAQFWDFLRARRTMLMEGAIDLPNGDPLNGENALIEVNSTAATRRIGNNLKSIRRQSKEQIILTPAGFHELSK